MFSSGESIDCHATQPGAFGFFLSIFTENISARWPGRPGASTSVTRSRCPPVLPILAQSAALLMSSRYSG